MTDKNELAVVVLGNDHSKIAFGNHVATYDERGNLKVVVNPTDAIRFPVKLEIVDFRNGEKPSFTDMDIPPGLFL
ncbi:hypothetical protein [Kluyvera ascorbata]|jgi:hypothetical protein|uniref:hypothetical protein n=1 Tax=Kluyvera ascorbata TaxID=51288 RepID=UPI002804EEAA|nr:hypothetical protein [Kluyvera ascorbata]MDU3913789.1 hypothetical protein [Kluyvera ascorbata]